MKRSAMNNSELNKQDVQNLAHSPQAEAKSVVAQKVGAYYNGRTITPNGKKLAEDIFRIMVRDIETKVRQILADSLKNCRNLPSDIVNAVINDIDAVATPFFAILFRSEQRRSNQNSQYA